VEKGTKIGILSSVVTSAIPVQDTILQYAASAGKDITTEISVADGAFEALTNGDRDLHDEKVRTALEQLVPKVDVVVFAQFSMALVKHPAYPVPVLKFGWACYDAAKRAIYHPEKAKAEEASSQKGGGLNA